MKRKAITILLTIVIIFGIIFAVQYAPTPISSKITLFAHSDTPPLLVAHRGFSAKYPQNTIPAIEGAIEAGFYGVEFDIHPTKDGIWILNHDETIDKMTDGSGNISDMTYNEILQYNVDYGNNHRKYKSLKLPKLSEALEIIAQSDILPYVEIKTHNPKQIEALTRMLKEYNLDKRAVIISFDLEALLQVYSLRPDIKQMLLCEEISKETIDICKQNGNIGLSFMGKNSKDYKEELKYAKEQGLSLGAWTIDKPIMADYLVKSYDYKVITTNRITP